MRTTGRPGATRRRPAARPAHRSRGSPPEVPDGVVNVTDPDTQRMKANIRVRAGIQRAGGRRRGADRARGGDHQHPDRFLAAGPDDRPRRSASSSGPASPSRPEVALADAQYWNEQHIDEVIANKHIQVLIPPDSGAAESPAGLDRRALRVDANRPCHRARQATYRKRKQMIEPVFAHTKHNRHVTRFHRRGRTAVRTECLSYVKQIWLVAGFV